jgi:hypothetical protein
VTDAADAPGQRQDRDWREHITVVLLAVTAIVTAWSGFQASKWSGAMSISFSQASTARIEATRLEGVANRKLTVQVSLFSEWLDAYQTGDEQLADFYVARFPEPLATTFPLWFASKPLTNVDAPSTPSSCPATPSPRSRRLGSQTAGPTRSSPRPCGTTSAGTTTPC